MIFVETQLDEEYSGIEWRRGSESNRRIKVLQTSPLPLGYRALPGSPSGVLFAGRGGVPDIKVASCAENVHLGRTSEILEHLPERSFYRLAALKTLLISLSRTAAVTQRPSHQLSFRALSWRGSLRVAGTHPMDGLFSRFLEGPWL